MIVFCRNDPCNIYGIILGTFGDLLNFLDLGIPKSQNFPDTFGAGRVEAQREMMVCDCPEGEDTVPPPAAMRQPGSGLGWSGIPVGSSLASWHGQALPLKDQIRHSKSSSRG